MVVFEKLVTKYFTPNSGADTYRVDTYMRSWIGPLSSQMRDDIGRNDFRGLEVMFYLLVNDPASETDLYCPHI